MAVIIGEARPPSVGLSEGFKGKGRCRCPSRAAVQDLRQGELPSASFLLDETPGISVLFDPFGAFGLAVLGIGWRLGEIPAVR